MCEKLAFCLLFICFQSGIKDRLKVVGGERESTGISLRLGHDSTREGKKRLVDGREREHCTLISPYYKKLTSSYRE